MKKTLSFSLAAIISAGILSATAYAADSADVYVTIADDKGALAVAYEKITVTDKDSDGALTISDALACAHDKFYDGGSQAGFVSYMGDYGIAMSKLWGVDNGGSYGYCKNNESALSLGDTVSDGDYISAYCYSDLNAWSDTYCYFDKEYISASNGDTIALTLYGNGFDDNWNPVTIAIEGAQIYLNSEATQVKTDSQGKAEITFENEGTYTISAKSDNQVLVPPVCIASVSADTAPDTGASSVGALILATCAVAVCSLNFKKRK